MVSSYVDTDTVQSLDQYLDSFEAESPSEPVAESDLLPESAAQDDEQSSEDEEQVAPESDLEQPQTQDTATDDTPSGESESTAAAAPAADWDSKENPYLEEARAFKALQQMAAEQKAEQEEKDRIERWHKGGLQLAEADEEDIPLLMDSLVEEISNTVTAPIQERVTVLEHGMTALVAAIEAEAPPELLLRIKQVAGEYRELGQSADQIQQAHTISLRERGVAKEATAKLQAEVKALRAELAAKVITDSGANRAESASVGGDTSGDLTWGTLLGYEEIAS